jgi:hypothetical protein
MSGHATGAVRLLLRLEGLCVLALALAAYAKFGAGWGVFAIAFLAPDLSFLGYLGGPRAGAIAYNLAHAYPAPLACLFLGLLLPAPAPTAAGLIWMAHIGFDRALGYGLKYARGFAHTHLGLLGRPPRPAGGA